MDLFLARVGIRHEDFKEVALGWSEQLVERGRQVAREAGRPFQSIASSHEDKQAKALRKAATTVLHPGGRTGGYLDGSPSDGT
ncbi:MAG: hypothetical protein KBE65_04815 [Phycisphaerae bacterium]|nr:hypothetical protein [Phycisphaerae bacterium]